MEKKTKSQRRKENAAKLWKQPVDTEDEADVLEDWARLVRKEGGWQVGRWRPLSNIIYARNLAEVKNHQKSEGLLVRNDYKWNLYLYYKSEFTHEEFFWQYQIAPAICHWFGRATQAN